jgi:hypothetical protein
MTKPQYIYQFREGAPLDEVGDLLFLAALAAESLHGRSSLRLDGTFLLEKEKRQCEVNAGSQVGRDLARIFTGFLVHQLGDKAFQVRLDDAHAAAAAKGGAL